MGIKSWRASEHQLNNKPLECTLELSSLIFRALEKLEKTCLAGSVATSIWCHVLSVEFAVMAMQIFFTFGSHIWDLSKKSLVQTKQKPHTLRLELTSVRKLLRRRCSTASSRERRVKLSTPHWTKNSQSHLVGFLKYVTISNNAVDFSVIFPFWLNIGPLAIKINKKEKGALEPRYVHLNSKVL